MLAKFKFIENTDINKTVSGTDIKIGKKLNNKYINAMFVVPSFFKKLYFISID